jgi:molecular chaperone DnaK
VPQIEVTFDIDADGILHVSRRTRRLGANKRSPSPLQSGLTKEEIERMVKEAQRYAEEDRKRKEEVEVRNNADSAVYQSEKMLRDLGDKVPADVRPRSRSKIATLKTAMGGRDVADIKRKTEELAQSLQKIGEKMYQQTGATPPPGGQAGGTPPGGSDTVDGEFREVKD